MQQIDSEVTNRFTQSNNSTQQKNLNFCFVFGIISYLCTRKSLGGLAQLVQSICLTSRGSAVRTRQPPPQKALSKDGAFFL